MVYNTIDRIDIINQQKIVIIFIMQQLKASKLKIPYQSRLRHLIKIMNTS